MIVSVSSREMSRTPAVKGSTEQWVAQSSSPSIRPVAPLPIPSSPSPVTHPATDYAVPLLSPTGSSALPASFTSAIGGGFGSPTAVAFHSSPIHVSSAAYTASSAYTANTSTHAAQPYHDQTQPAYAHLSSAIPSPSSFSSTAASLSPSDAASSLSPPPSSEPAAGGLTFPSALSASIASMSKAELITQLQQARRDAAREAEETRQREENSRRLALEAELSALSLAVAQRKDVAALHAQAASELASKQASYAALQDEIRRLQELVELEVKKKESMRAAQQMEVTALRVKLEQERLEQERKARLLAAQIAAVKMEIQDRKAKYRARKQADLHRRVMVEERQAEEQKHNEQEQEMAALKKQRDAMEKELATHTSSHGVLKSFTIDQQPGGSPQLAGLAC